MNIQENNAGQGFGEDDVRDIMKFCMPFIARYWRPVMEEFQFPWLDESWKTFILWILSIVVDPLICYVPVINNEKKSLEFDILFLVIIFVLYGAIYFSQLSIYVGKFNKLEDGSHSKLWRAFVVVAPLVPIITNILLLLLLKFKATKVIRASIFSVGMAIFLILHLMRVLGISKLFITASRMKTAVPRIGINFLLYFYGGHLFGGLWYFFAVWKTMECWNRACTSHAGCYYANDQFIISSEDNNFLDDICFNKKTYELGIFNEALESRIVETRNFWKKLLFCFRWGIQNLSGFGESLLASTHTWENVFVILIVIYGMVTFTFFVGNMQNLVKHSISKSEETRWTRQDLEKWSPFGKLSRDDQNLIVRKCRQCNWPQTGVVNVKNLLNNLPEGVEKDIKRILCLNMLRQVQKFESWSNVWLNELCDSAKPVLFYEKYAQIVQKDRSIDEMIFVMKGKLRIYSFNGGRKSISHLEDAGFCGEELVHFVQNNPESLEPPISNRTIQVVKQVDAFALVFDDLKDVIMRQANHASTQQQAPIEGSQQSTQEQAPIDGSQPSTQEQAPSEGSQPQPAY